MVEISISETMVQNRIKRIFDFIDDDSNEGSLELRLKHAWYELFGMQGILAEATHAICTDDQEKQEFDRIRGCLAQALLDIVQLYDQAVAGKKLSPF